MQAGHDITVIGSLFSDHDCTLFLGSNCSISSYSSYVFVVWLNTQIVTMKSILVMKILSYSYVWSVCQWKQVPLRSCSLRCGQQSPSHICNTSIHMK